MTYQAGISALADANLLNAQFRSTSPRIAEIVAVHALNNPDSPALIQGAKQLSFAELYREAKKTAVALQRAGLRREDAVGIYLESSIDFIVAALGIWYAGGAYLPIDPAYPAARANYILSDSDARAVITRRELMNTLDGNICKVLLVEEVASELVTNEAIASVASHSLAYVIYTSGSSGQPKGVEISHGSLENLVDWHNHEFSVTNTDRATQIAGPGFDAAVWEIWPYLAAGGSLHIPPPQARLSGLQLRDWLLAENITMSFAPTVLAEEMLRIEWPSTASLRYLFTGGDTLHTFPSESAPFDLVNNYGPSECAVVATSALVSLAQSTQGVPAIGRAISNTSIHLLDEAAREVGDDAVGELYVGGAGVGRGYRNRPDLTAESFVEILVAGKSERVFRTGDLARKLPDGQYAFVGRVDDQIKIRGFRIEPGEIASVLNRHAAVTTSAVIARDHSGEKTLVAYIVAKAELELLDRDLRDFLAKQLPDYMIPSHFVLVNRIPVTINGKLDKAALPAPTEYNQLKRDTYVAPRDEFEEILEEIISPILGRDKISIHDNFFMLGGHSLMGAQLIAKVRDIFDVELILRNVFECPTVAKLAARVELLLTARLQELSEEEFAETLRLPPVSQSTGVESAVKVG